MMLTLLHESGSVLPTSICMAENYPIDKTTVLEDVSYDSFEWVIRKTIRYIEEH